MKTKNKIIFSILIGMTAILGILVFCIFFYPDETLQDNSELIPALQNVPQADNAYYLVEEAKKAYQKPKYSENLMILFLTGKPDYNNKVQNIDEDDINQFLISEESSIKFLEQAVELPSYENIILSNPQTLDIYTGTPAISISDSAMTKLIEMLYVKGLYELKEKKSTQAVQTVKNAMTLAAKIRKNSLRLEQYRKNHFYIVRGKDLLHYFVNEKAITPAEIVDFSKSLEDENRKDYINSLKFEFQIFKNSFNKFSFGAWNIFSRNNYNFRRNATINGLADKYRSQITEITNYDCLKSAEQTEVFTNTTIFTNNGVGIDYIETFYPKNIPEVFCDESIKL